jgi:hypothetical protein
MANIRWRLKKGERDEQGGRYVFELVLQKIVCRPGDVESKNLRTLDAPD